MKAERICAGMLLCTLLLHGCGSARPAESTAADAVPEITSEVIETTTEPQREDGVFDFELVSDNIAFSSDKIELMTAVSDIGRGYTLEYYDNGETVNGMKFDCANLLYNSVYIATVFLEADDSKALEDEAIFEINFYSYYSEQEKTAARYVKADRLKIGDDLEKVTEYYGEPDEIKSGALGTTEYWYKNDSGDHFMAESLKDKITGITIGLNR